MAFYNPIMISQELGDRNHHKLRGKVSTFANPFQCPLTMSSFSDLYNLSITGTGLHSWDRRLPPRCHPGTRVALLQEIADWMGNPLREEDMFWIYGPPGIGKSAVAQSTGEFASTQGVLGAAFFLLREREKNNPSRFFITIASELAEHHPEYRHHLLKILETTERLLEQSLNYQFEKLLVEPLSDLPLQRKLLIIIDGLDQCDGVDDRVELIKLLRRRSSDLPIIWLICSRPEIELKNVFNDDRAGGRPCHKRELSLEEPNSQNDIKTYVEDRLGGLAREYSDHFDSDDWPTSNDLERLVSKCSGLFLYATTLLSYISDRRADDPDGQLEAALTFIDNPRLLISPNSNPLKLLDSLYMGVLMGLPKDKLDMSLTILGSCTVCPPLPAMHLSNLLHLEQKQFYSALRPLHSILFIPPREKAFFSPLRYFHLSFSEFLAAKNRSITFWRDEATHCARILTEFLLLLQCERISYSRDLLWVPVFPGRDDDISPRLLLTNNMFDHAATHAWSICSHIHNPDPEFLLRILKFDFRRLQSVAETIPTETFTQFLRWIHAQVGRLIISYPPLSVG